MTHIGTDTLNLKVMNHYSSLVACIVSFWLWDGVGGLGKNRGGKGRTRSRRKKNKGRAEFGYSVFYQPQTMAEGAKERGGLWHIMPHT